MSIVYLLLGSNLGNREKNLQDALTLIEIHIGKIISRSSVHNTAPWGMHPPDNKQSDFLNQAICVETSFSAHELLEKILDIEKSLGRERRKKWEARIIDVDILFFNSGIITTPGLIIPHPYLHQRKFALSCLNEIAGDFIHPEIKKTVKQLLEECVDTLTATKLVF